MAARRLAGGTHRLAMEACWLAGEARRLFRLPLPRGAPGSALRPRKGPARFSVPVLGEGTGKEGLGSCPFYRLPSGPVFSPVPAPGRGLGVWALEISTARRGAGAGRPLSSPPTTCSLSSPSLPREWGMRIAHPPGGGNSESRPAGRAVGTRPRLSPGSPYPLSRRRG